jgi:hypothetical protein
MRLLAAVTITSSAVIALVAVQCSSFGGADTPTSDGGAADGPSEGVLTHPYQGTVFNLTVDDEGVYFGEHGVGVGAGTLSMLVKK